jgi:hypothetical protein
MLAVEEADERNDNKRIARMNELHDGDRHSARQTSRKTRVARVKVNEHTRPTHGYLGFLYNAPSHSIVCIGM